MSGWHFRPNRPLRPKSTSSSRPASAAADAAPDATGRFGHKNPGRILGSGDRVEPPVIGDDGFARYVRHAYRDGSISRNEQFEALRRHYALLEEREPAVSEDEMIELITATFESMIMETQEPMCAYRRHRGEGRDWRADDGRLICGICHPPIVSRFAPQDATPVDVSPPPDGPGQARQA